MQDVLSILLKEVLNWLRWWHHLLSCQSNRHSSLRQHWLVCLEHLRPLTQTLVVILLGTEKLLDLLLVFEYFGDPHLRLFTSHVHLTQQFCEIDILATLEDTFGQI